MRNRKLIREIFNHSSDDKTPAVVALVAGLAIGAALGVLFAPERGNELRKRIGGLTNRFGNKHEEEAETSEQPKHQQHAGQKKPKSDIKALVHEAHVAAAEHDADQDKQQ